MNALLHFLYYIFRLRRANTQTTDAERACLARYAQNRERLVEIGVFEGVTTKVLRGAMADNAVLFAIDHFQKNRLGICYYEIVAHMEVSRAKRGSVRWINMKGVDALRASVICSSAPLDFAFLDGDHSWKGVQADWEGLQPLLGIGAIVALHDSRHTGGHESEEFTEQVILADRRFTVRDTVDTLTILEKIS